jgi:hypothetical protein
MGPGEKGAGDQASRCSLERYQNIAAKYFYAVEGFDRVNNNVNISKRIFDTENVFCYNALPRKRFL